MLKARGSGNGIDSTWLHKFGYDEKKSRREKTEMKESIKIFYQKNNGPKQIVDVKNGVRESTKLFTLWSRHPNVFLSTMLHTFPSDDDGDSEKNVKGNR